MSIVKYDFPITRIACPVESIIGVWEFIRPPFFTYLCYSLPGHLLHLVTKGSYTVKISGRKYHIKEGDIIYYYESEEVDTIGNETEVTFFSIGFEAPKLSPLPIEKRVFNANDELHKLFRGLYEEFSSEKMKARNFKVYANLLNILNNIGELYFESQNTTIEKEKLWWAVERRIRRNKMFRPSLDDLCEIAGYSRATVIRSCRKVTGETPFQRIRRIRMEEARGLLSFAHLNVTQVAEYLGYPRIHEFSREFSTYFGKPPSTLLGKKENI